jgi:hypothetical protein
MESYVPKSGGTKCLGNNSSVICWHAASAANQLVIRETREGIVRARRRMYVPCDSMRGISGWCLAGEW